MHLVASNPLLSSAIPLLISAGADTTLLDSDGKSAIERAASHNGNAKVVGTLLRCGADSLLTGARGLSILLAAIRKSEDFAIVDELIRAGANIHYRDAEGASAIHHAVKLGRNAAKMRDIAHSLIVAGADVNAKDQAGRSVLDCAMGSPSAVELLWDAGVDLQGCDLEALCITFLGKRRVGRRGLSY